MGRMRSDLVGTADAARAVGLSLRTLWRLIADERVTPTARTPGGHRRWDVDDLRRQLAELQHHPEPHRADVPADPLTAAALVVSSRGVLVVRRRDDRPPWAFPAGKVEHGESVEDAAVRETKEECGLEVQAAGHELARRIHPMTNTPMAYLPCKVRGSLDVHVGDPVELSAVEWVRTLAEVDRRMPDMMPAVRAYLIDELAREMPPAVFRAATTAPKAKRKPSSTRRPINPITAAWADAAADIEKRDRGQNS
jgi:8-oxo-dGTP diphosphatase